MLGKLSENLASDPFKTLAMLAALVALASTPVAFAVLGRLDWFQARRGRVLMKPSFTTIVVGMMLVMSIPAILAAVILKSGDFDKNRYEFDPNKTWSVLEQGNRFRSVQEADAAVVEEMKRLGEERKNLVDDVKKLDEAMLALRGAAAQSQATAQAIPAVLERLATLRRAVRVDAPQQLMDFTAPAVTGAIAGTGNGNGNGNAAGANGPMVANAAGSFFAPNGTGGATANPALTPNPNPGGTAPLAAAAKAGLTPAEADAEYATVAEPQRRLASMLPLADLPAGWEVAKSGGRHLEAFNAENMFEKIDGRAESFTQNNVTGMAYASYHPIGDDSNDVQLYIFEFDHTKPLRAQSKYNSEKPDELTKVAIGTEGYTSAGSLIFFADPFYTQFVATVDDPKFTAFAKALAERVAAKQKPAPSAGGEGEGDANAPPSAEATAAAIYALLPAGPGKADPKFVAQDVFGYGFLSDVYMADYKEGEATWQGFLRPYATVAEAEAVFAKYLAAAKQDGGDAKLLETPGADQLVVCSNVGLVDAIFRRGSVIGGANGAADAAKAEAFARAFAKGLPAAVPGAGAK